LSHELIESYEEPDWRDGDEDIDFLDGWGRT